MKIQFALGALIAVLAMAVAGAAVYASIPGPTGVVNGCYTNGTVNGAHGLAVIDSSGVCPAGTTALNWNQTGPQGPAGPPGISGYEVVTSTISVTGPAINWNTQAVCPTGKVAVGGGYQLNPGGITNYFVDANTIHPNHGGWEVALDYYNTAPFTLTATAVCTFVQ